VGNGGFQPRRSRNFAREPGGDKFVKSPAYEDLTRAGTHGLWSAELRFGALLSTGVTTTPIQISALHNAHP